MLVLLANHVFMDDLSSSGELICIAGFTSLLTMVMGMKSAIGAAGIHETWVAASPGTLGSTPAV